MKKILIVVPSLAIGGQEKAAVDNAEILKTEFDVKLVLFDKRDVEYETSCDKIYLNVGASKSKFAKILGQIKRAIKLMSLRRKEKADIVYSFGSGANLTNSLSGIFSRGKTIVAIHGFEFVRKSALNSFVFKHADKVICIAQAMKDALLKIYPFLEKKAVLVENGYNIKQIKAKSKEESVLLKSGSPQYIAMGRLDPVKGFDRLIKAFAMVLKEIPEAQLTIIGVGKLEASLKEMCEDLKISGSVNFVGYHKNPFALLAKADIFMLSSHSEGFPNAIIEAMTCGVACISVDCMSGPREILCESYSDKAICGVVEEKYGVLVEQSDDEEYVASNLAKAMVIVAKDGELLHKYKDIGPERAEHFSTDVLKSKLLALFEES